MKYQDVELIDELAAQYALGTLRGRARRRMERICRQDAAARSAVRRWEDRLAGLAQEVTPVQPPARVLQIIRTRLNQNAPGDTPRFPWWRSRTWLALAASVAVLVLALQWFTGADLTEPRVVAEIADERQIRLWSIEAGGDELRVAAEPQLTLSAANAYELWALSESGGAPVSLGLMPLTGQRVLALSAEQRRALARARQVAISREPLGGSPTGAPTGPVLFVAEITKA